MRRLAFLLLLTACPPRPAPRPALPVDGGAAAFRLWALGDSFTIGTGSPESASFPARLAARWSRSGARVELRNLARNGYTTQDLLDKEIPQLGAADLVTLAIGANDIFRGEGAERYRAQLRRILAALRARGIEGHRVVAVPQPDWSLAPAVARFDDPAALAGRIERYNDVLREEVSAAGGRYVDLFPLMRRQARAGRFAEDGLHPAAAAYDEWAAALKEALGTRGPAE